MKKEYDIFISYRREGGKEYARNLTSELVSRGFHPFLDFDELKDGKFDKRITDAIESAPVFMFILSPGSLDRCVNEEDWVRKEILHAVKYKRHIVPVDIDKQFEAFPSMEDFPQEIKNALGQHQFSQIQTETLYKVSIDEMVKNRIQPAIDEYMREKQKAAGMAGAEIHIETDMDCHVQRFHRDMIIAKVDEENVIHLPKGKHKLQFISVENPDVKDSCEYKVEDVTDSDFIDVYLREKAGVIAAETDEMEKLKDERKKLTSTVNSLQDQLKTAKSDAQQISVLFTTTEKALHSKIKEISRQLKETTIKLEERGLEIVTLEQRLSETSNILDKVQQELLTYKEIETEQKTEEKEGCKTEKERHIVEVESNIKAETGQKTGVQKQTEDEKGQCIVKVGNVEFKMINIAGGAFIMGEGPNARHVTVSDYYIGETPVTQALWKEIMDNNPSSFNDCQKPVERVSWDDCQKFITKLNHRTGNMFRLPTEAEWEYAARGGRKSKGYKYAGSNNIDEVAWYEDNSFKKGSASSDYGTHPVKTKKPNELGIYDMSGNVWEWCHDWFGYYDTTPQLNPSGPINGIGRVTRGGSWCNEAWDCRSLYRFNYFPDYSNRVIGFRIALSK